MTRALRTVEVPRVDGAGLSAFVRDVRDALHGTGPALLPVPTPEDASPAPGEPSPEAVDVPEPVALAVRTSGSSGEPRTLLLDRTALAASAAATHARLGGPGRWLLTLPAHHVAGLQVLCRSLLAGHDPALAPPGPFTAESFSATVRATLDASRGAAVHTSLVPTQLHRVLRAAEDDPALLAPLRDLGAILVGGAATPPDDVAAARAHGLRVVTTYGMTETCGGCVYDGLPLDGVEVALADDGSVEIAGPVLARGHLGRPDLDAAAFVERDGRRWFRTRDLGTLDADGRLSVLGRADDVLVTGGAKVAPAAVERVLTSAAGRDLGVGEAVVVGVPDPEWGQAVVAVVVPVGAATDGRAPELGRLRDLVARTLGRAAAPRHLVLVEHLPARGPGKVDRSAAVRIAQAAVERS